MDNKQRYEAALHAMQTGVKLELGREGVARNPDRTIDVLHYVKHLRTGNNARAVDHAALIRLLIAKGLFTLEEYEKEIADEMEREKQRYERRISPDGRVMLV
jgi:hypothetical protein